MGTAITSPFYRTIRTAMTRDEFEDHAQTAYDALPEFFKQKIDNVRIIVEDYPSEKEIQSVHVRSKYHLLGLYQGVPTTYRNTWYGATPMMPDTIFLYQKNIENVCTSVQEIEKKIRDVLIHEIAHYFGMNEEQVRAAGY
jgi:predicted Zn-dependent protease with MMP-like domain